MKKILYSITIIGFLFACSKNEIEIQKNTDLSWEIDKKIQDDDIRNRIGKDYDKVLLYLENSDADIEFIKIGNNVLGLVQDQVTTKILLSQPYTEDVKATIKFDTEKTKEYVQKNSIKGYKAFSETDVQLSDTEIIIPKGETSKEITFTLPSALNNGNLVAVYTLGLTTQKDDLIVPTSKASISVVIAESGNNIESSYEYNPRKGSRIDGKTITANFTKGGTLASRFVDNSYYNYATLNLANYPDNGLDFNFGKEVTISAIRLVAHARLYQRYYAKSLKVFSDGMEIGTAHFDKEYQTGDRYYTLNFKKPIKVSSLTLTNFVKAADFSNGVTFAEIDFYEE